MTEIKLKAGSAVTVKVSGPAIVRISPPGPPLPAPPLLTTEQLAAYLGEVSVRTLEDWRRLGTGPDYVPLSPKMVRYRAAAVERWLDGLERSARDREARAAGQRTYVGARGRRTRDAPRDMPVTAYAHGAPASAARQ